MSEIPHVWTCPSCGRRVPPRVPACRCGFQQTDAPPPLPDAAAPRTAPPQRPWGLLVVALIPAAASGALAVAAVLGGVSLAAIGGVLALLVRTFFG